MKRFLALVLVVVGVSGCGPSLRKQGEKIVLDTGVFGFGSIDFGIFDSHGKGPLKQKTKYVLVELVEIEEHYSEVKRVRL